MTTSINGLGYAASDAARADEPAAVASPETAVSAGGEGGETLPVSVEFGSARLLGLMR